MYINTLHTSKIKYELYATKDTTYASNHLSSSVEFWYKICVERLNKKKLQAQTWCSMVVEHGAAAIGRAVNCCAVIISCNERRC
eukprot:scaffold14356_cov194-Skeletonema_marinoi.AAC.14